MKRWLPLSLLAMLCLSPAAGRADDARTAELERKVDVLTQEIENMKLGDAAPDTGRLVSRMGLGPAASKVYGERSGVSIGGYGEMLLDRFDRAREDDTPSGAVDRIDFLRQVLYFGYKFNDQLLFNSEIELEHAGVKDEAEVEVDPLTGEGEAELSGEVGLEFAYVEWAPRPTFGARAGMLLIPLGWTNELHEPPIFFTARRPDVEQRIIPTTWRGNGAGVFGELPNGLAWRAYVTEGLNAAHFSAAGGIRSGRQSGSQSLATKPAFSGRVDWASPAGFVVGASAFTGDAWQEAQPAGGNLAPRVTLCDAHARVQWRALEARALYAAGSMSDADLVSDALGLTGSDRLGERFFGAYVEGAWDVLAAFAPGSRYGASVYARFETWDTQEDVDAAGADDPANERSALTIGASFKPHPNVVVKLDRQNRHDEADTAVGQWSAALGYLF